MKSQNGSLIRNALRDCGRDSSRSPEDIVGSLTENERRQLILTLEDRSIVRAIEGCVRDREIEVPINEIRTAHQQPHSVYQDDSPTQLSTLGVRGRFSTPVRDLYFLVTEAYDACGMTSELAWKLEIEDTSNLGTSLAERLRSMSQTDILNKLILSTKTVCEYIARVLDMDEDALRGISPDVLLWKLGFNVPRYDDMLPRFSTSLSDFLQTIMQVPESVETEADRARLRSAGVNPFVDCESFLEAVLCYNVWMLFSDHFAETRFRYRLLDGRISVGKHLGKSLKSDAGEMCWRDDGNNTLGVLLRYLSELQTRVGQLSTIDRTSLQRPPESLPRYANYSRRIFPFRHTQLWADSTPRELNLYLAQLTRFNKVIGQSRVAEVRNALDHKRDRNEFPSSERLTSCVTCLQQGLKIADAARLFPKLYWLTSRRITATGIQELIYEDIHGTQLHQYLPAIVSGLSQPIFAEPEIFAPVNFLAHPQSLLLFRLADESSFTQYWNNYPQKAASAPEDVSGSGMPQLAEQA